MPPPAPDETRFDEGAQVLRALRDAGFVDARTVVSPCEVVLPDLDAWLAWLHSMEFGDYLARMEPVTFERFRNASAVEFGAQTEAPETRFRMDALLTSAHRPVLEAPDVIAT